jgi:hypothetical protein
VAAKRRPTAEDRLKAIGIALAGVARGVEFGPPLLELEPLHPRNNTFPGEVLLELAADALDEAGATRDRPLDYEGIRERYLPECEFRGRSDHRKSHYALGAAAMLRAGVQPDLLGEVTWWNSDDLWVFAFYALVIYARAAADRCGEPVAEVCQRIAARYGIDVATTPER